MEHSLDELLAGLASPDPAVRDGWAADGLREGLVEGRWSTAEIARIRETALARLTDYQVHVRSFAALVLAWLVLTGERDPRIAPAALDWCSREEDTRGWDDELGWLHAVAHGADLLGALVRTDLAEPQDVLGAIGARMVAPGPAWTHQEHARLAAAAYRALERSTDVSAAWLEPVEAALTRFEESTADTDAAAGDPTAAPPPGWTHNVETTCTTLALVLAQGHPAPDHELDPAAREATSERLQGICARIVPYLFASPRP